MMAVWWELSSLLPQFLGPVLVQTLTQELSALWIYGYPHPPLSPGVSPYTQLQLSLLMVVYHQLRNITITNLNNLRFTIEREKQLEKGFWSSKHRARGMAPHNTGVWEDWLPRNAQIRKPNETKWNQNPQHRPSIEEGKWNHWQNIIAVARMQWWTYKGFQLPGFQVTPYVCFTR